MYPYIIHQNSPLAWAVLIYIHYQQNESMRMRPSTNMHKQQASLHLQSLKFGVILHARKISKTLEERCVSVPKGLFWEGLLFVILGPASSYQLPIVR